MKYMLDTDTCIYVINRRPQSVFDRFKTERVGDIGLSSIALSELRYGAEKSGNPEKNGTSLADFITPLEILEYGEEQAEEYGRIRSYLERQGEPIASMDMLIAAHAVSLGITLVTNNQREFRRVPGLEIETWT
ncbi:MAG: type II toxin-antitoxin system VapC family toxin [Spirochaeta sp.]|jgi:tRNA(fMet)-specific endonuclease VapC|nr:type II toxin-antitoxin system VapC family toxin [Spirochaeta sp.]